MAEWPFFRCGLEPPAVAEASTTITTTPEEEEEEEQQQQKTAATTTPKDIWKTLLFSWRSYHWLYFCTHESSLHSEEPSKEQLGKPDLKHVKNKNNL